MKRNIIIALILVLALIGGGSIAYYYNYQNSHYVTTDDARVTTGLVTVNPVISGKITQWDVKEGDQVKEGQVLGKQDTSLAAASSMSGSQAANAAANPQAAKAATDLLASMAQIKAPISGKVVQSNAIKGQMAAPAMSVAVIANTSDTYISANIKETNINQVKKGQKVDITIDAFPGKTFTGRVNLIGQAATSVFSLLPSTNTSGSYTKVTQLIPVKITIDDTKGLDLMPGMNASIKIYK